MHFRKPAKIMMKKLLLTTYTLLLYLTSQAQIITTVAGVNRDGGLAINTPIFNAYGIAIDASGNIYFSDDGHISIRKVNASTGILTTVAGNGTGGFGGDGSAATAANLFYQSGITLDALGNLYIADAGNNRIRKVNASTGIITTIAGNGTQGFGGDGSAAIAASLYFPTGVSLDASGNLYIADQSNHRIRKVNAITGIISTVAGNGNIGFGGDGISAASASLNYPTGVTIDSLGNLFIADNGNHRIRKVNAGTGIITTVAGNGTGGFGGDGAAATAAKLNNPISIALDTFGNLFIVDQYNNRIRKVNASTGIITTIAGNGTAGFGGDGSAATAAKLNNPNNVILDALGNLYIVDKTNNRIRKVNASTGIITTIAGNGTEGFGGDGAAATAAYLFGPAGVALDTSGNLYIADQSNHRIRKVNGNTGIITTIAGNGTYGFGGDSSAATAAKLYNPSGITLDVSGNLYIADAGNHRIRKINASTGIITTVAGNGTAGWGGDGAAATAANLYYPTGVSMDVAGNLYIADYYHRIRMVNASTGIITRVAGNGTAAFGGDGGIANSASLNSPYGLAFDASGNLYIADYGNHRIRKVDASNGIITTVAGNGTQGFGGDGGAATAASLNHPSGVRLDASGNLYIADKSNNRIRKVNAITGIITSIAGNGTGGFGGDGAAATAANLSNPFEVCLDASDNLYISDHSNHRLRKVWFSVSNNAISGGQTICLGSNTDTLFGSTPIGGDGTYSYNWLKSTTSGNSGFASIPSSNTISYKPSSLTQNTWYRRIVISGAVMDTSAALLITISKPIANNFIGGSNQTICFGSLTSTISASIPSGGDGSNYIYKWLVSNTNATSGFSAISSSNVQNYTPALLTQNTWFKRIVSSGACASDTSTAFLIQVNPKPTAGFTSNTANQCLNTNSYLFSDTSKIASGAISRLWTLGNGDTTSIGNPSKVFGNAGTYSIKLLATSDNGCKDSLIKSVIVYPNTNIGFKVNNVTQCLNGNSFLYTDTSSLSSGTYIRVWNFGDFTSSTANLFTKTYYNANTYQVKLVSTTNNGCKDSISKSVTVYPKPDVYFMNTNPSQCLKGNHFSFPDSSFIGSGSISRTWYMGDGSTDTNLVANKSYTQAKTYQVKLVVTSNNACKDSMINDVVVNPQPLSVATAQGRTIVCPGEIVNLKASTTNGNTYQWLKNEVPLPSSTDSILQTTVIGIYKVITSTAFACADTSQGVSIEVKPLPKANIGINNIAQCLSGNQFRYTDSSTLASGSLHRLWYLNSVISDTAFSINKSYNVAGNYTIKLLAISETNCKDSITKTITVHPQPTPDFTINNPSQCLVPNSFVFTDVSSISSGSTTRTWYTGSGNNAISAVATQVYSNVGNHSVKLVSKSDKACSDSISKIITVNANPVAGVMLGQTTNVAATTPYIYSVAQQLNHTYLWSVTNGIVVAGQGTNAVTVQWIGIGSSKIQAIVTNPQGCNDTSSLTLSVTNVGIKELQSLSQLEIYPNPNNGDFKLKITSTKASETHISLLNMLGQEVWADTKTLSAGNQEMDLSTNVAVGVYILRLNNEDGQVQKSVVVR